MNPGSIPSPDQIFFLIKYASYYQGDQIGCFFAI